MTPKDRRSKIITLVRQRNQISVDELVEIIGISPETIRRDLSKLAGTGKIQKFHGGAMLPSITAEGPFHERMNMEGEAKTLIAKQAPTVISPGQTVFIDTGSTTLYFCEELAKIPQLTIITNSAEIAKTMDLNSAQSRVFLLGGQYSSDNRQTIGPMVISQIKNFRAHHAILTISALDERTGIMDCSFDEAQIARAMIKQSESITVLADKSKLGAIASFGVCSLDEIDNLICEQKPHKALLAALNLAGVNVIRAS